MSRCCCCVSASIFSFTALTAAMRLSYVLIASGSAASLIPSSLVMYAFAWVQSADPFAIFSIHCAAPSSLTAPLVSMFILTTLCPS